MMRRILRTFCSRLFRPPVEWESIPRFYNNGRSFRRPTDWRTSFGWAILLESVRSTGDGRCRVTKRSDPSRWASGMSDPTVALPVGSRIVTSPSASASARERTAKPRDAPASAAFDAADGGMGMRRPDRTARCTRYIQIVGILPLPGNEALILSVNGRIIAVRTSIGLQPHSVTVLL